MEFSRGHRIKKIFIDDKNTMNKKTKGEPMKAKELLKKVAVVILQSKMEEDEKANLIVELTEAMSEGEKKYYNPVPAGSYFHKNPNPNEVTCNN